MDDATERELNLGEFARYDPGMRFVSSFGYAYLCLTDQFDRSPSYYGNIPQRASMASSSFDSFQSASEHDSPQAINSNPAAHWPAITVEDSTTTGDFFRGQGESLEARSNALLHELLHSNQN